MTLTAGNFDTDMLCQRYNLMLFVVHTVTAKLPTSRGINEIAIILFIDDGSI